MYDTGKILPGLAVFLGFATFPIWYNVGRGQQPQRPEIEKPANQERCVEDVEYMRREHMQLVMSWRDEAVRQNRRIYVTTDGRHFEKSLTRTCLGCHTNKAASCDRCHNYLAVSPYCWDCHVDPKGGR
jgi:hypothetical protein